MRHGKCTRVKFHLSGGPLGRRINKKPRMPKYSSVRRGKGTSNALTRIDYRRTTQSFIRALGQIIGSRCLR